MCYSAPAPTTPPLCQVLKRTEYQAALEQFNRRMGRPLLSGGAAGAGGAPAAAASASLLATPSRPGAAPSFSLPRLNSGGASNVGAKASAAAQDVAARLAKSTNLNAAKASAAAAGESMRDSMTTAMRAMKGKSLRFLQRSDQQP